MSQLTFRLWGLINRENNESTNYMIAQTILENLYNIEDTSTAAVAKLCNVSKPSISRFSKELGYSDYYEFRMDLRDKRSYTCNVDSYAGISNHKLPHTFLENCKKGIERLEENIDEMEVAQIARSILHHSKVYIMGNMQAGSVVQTLQFNLFSYQKMSISVTDVTEQEEVIRRLNGDELLIFFSTSGRIVKELPLEHIPSSTEVYLITTNPKIQKIPGIHVLNAGTGEDLSAGNISLNYIADMIYLEFAYYKNSFKS